MGIWIGVALIGLVVAGLAFWRFLVPASSEVDLGQVSQSWITQARGQQERTLAPGPTRWMREHHGTK